MRSPSGSRDGWGVDDKDVVDDARADGSDSPVIHVFLPKSRADDLARVVAAQAAANETLEYKGVPSTAEGIEARQGMETRRDRGRQQTAEFGGCNRRQCEGLSGRRLRTVGCHLTGQDQGSGQRLLGPTFPRLPGMPTMIVGPR